MNILPTPFLICDSVLENMTNSKTNEHTLLINENTESKGSGSNTKPGTIRSVTGALFNARKTNYRDVKSRNSTNKNEHFDYADLTDSLDEISQPETYNEDIVDSFTLKRPSKFRAISILFSVLILISIILLVVVILGIAIYRYVTARQEPIHLNIHIKVDSCEELATYINRNVTLYDPEQKIDLKDYQQPHITLYMTKFELGHFKTLEKEVEQILQQEASYFKQCTVRCMESEMKNVSTYAMWEVENSECIQKMSDRLVEQLSSFTTLEARSEVPDWVNQLPKHLKEKKIEMIKKYGSPNVFSLFDPHVTLAYDDVPSRLQKAFDANAGIVKNCVFTPTAIAFGQVGEYGTIIRGRDYCVFKFSHFI